MVTFSVIEGVKRTLVSGKTPSKNELPNLNRKARRDLVFKHRVKHLYHNVSEVRRGLVNMGIEPPPMTRFRNRKMLSGHMSQLIAASQQA